MTANQQTVAAIVLYTLTVGALLLMFATETAADTNKTVCVSAIGPVDAQGHGDTTPNLKCHTIGAQP